jgi:hypothetical protein
MAVMISAIRKAGRLKPMSTPKMWGAASRVCARATRSAEGAETT